MATVLKEHHQTPSGIFLLMTNKSLDLSIMYSLFEPQVASSGNIRQSEALSDSSGSERAHSLSSGDQHRVLPYLWSVLLWLCTRGWRCTDSWELCNRAQLSAASPKGCWGTLHLHQWLEGAAGHPGEGERNEPGAEGGQEEEAAGVVLQLPSADEGEVHGGHRGELLQKCLTSVFFV